MKTINYRGMTFEVEDRFKYVAMDADGRIFAFVNEPEVFKVYSKWYSNPSEYLGNINNGWENSLESI